MLTVRRELLAAVVAASALAGAPSSAATEPPATVTDRCAVPIDEQLPDDPAAASLPEPVVESLDICASWYRPVVDDDGDLVAVEFSTAVAGDTADLPPGAYFSWDWFAEDDSCYHQAVLSLGPDGPQALVRDQCRDVPPPPLVDFFVGYVAGPPVVAVPVDGARVSGSSVVLRLDLATLPERVQEILAPGTVLARPHTHSGTLNRGGRAYLVDLETASDDARDVQLPSQG